MYRIWRDFGVTAPGTRRNSLLLRFNEPLQSAGEYNYHFFAPSSLNAEPLKDNTTASVGFELMLKHVCADLSLAVD